MKHIILIGKQGSGKGTQGRILAEKYGYTIFETGAELRKIAATDTKLGKEVKETTERGDLVSNDLVMRIVEEFLEKTPKTTPIIFDGIPRSEIQRESLEQELKKAEADFVALHITLSDEEAMNRLLKRGTAEDTGSKFGVQSTAPLRADDNTAGIMKRLANFEAHTAPVVEYWRSTGKLIEVSGEQTPPEVTANIKQALGL